MKEEISDDGKSWGRAVGLGVEAPEREDDAWTKVYEATHGDTFEDGHYEVYQIRSKDGGLTWSEPERICETKEPTKAL